MSALFYLWRSDSPSGVSACFESLEAAHGAMRHAMATIHDRSIEWCVIRADDDSADLETVVCGRHGDLV